jgi:hypothetical protein
LKTSHGREAHGWFFFVLSSLLLRDDTNEKGRQQAWFRLPTTFGVIPRALEAPER